MRYLLPSLVLALAVLAPPAARPAAAATDCANAATTVELNECSAARYKEADKRLNQSYADAKKTLDASGAKLLLDAQRAWLKYRDANCAVAADMGRGGTIATMLATDCLADMTEARAKELDTQAKGLGN